MTKTQSSALAKTPESRFDRTGRAAPEQTLARAVSSNSPAVAGSWGGKVTTPTSALAASIKPNKAGRDKPEPQPEADPQLMGRLSSGLSAG